ncbi:hypothetical protein AB0L65_32770 [Nonomuraea sp. NPDC052116]|uniref:hypothetical protein n=1 Tax=Nonomuraea sp. NPDC052116 TaxID=3155665 RepID=UPI003419DC91
MKAGGPLKRYTELKAKTPMNRGKGFTKTTNTPKPKSNPKTAPKPVVDLVKARSGGMCEIGLLCLGAAPATQRAHRMGKGSGGVGKGNTVSNRAANLLDACSEDHYRIDNAEVADAERLGLKVRRGVALPSEVPVFHFRYGWVLLDDEGGLRAAPPMACRPGDLLPVVACTTWELIQQSGAFAEAMDRFGHIQCPGWSAPLEGLFTCGCGSSPFVVLVVA